MSLFERDYRTLRTIRRYFFPELSPLRPIICCALCTVKIHGELKVNRSHCTKVDRRTRKYDVLGHNNSHTHSTQLNSHTLLIQTQFTFTQTPQLTFYTNNSHIGKTRPTPLHPPLRPFPLSSPLHPPLCPFPLPSFTHHCASTPPPPPFFPCEF